MTELLDRQSVVVPERPSQEGKGGLFRRLGRAAGAVRGSMEKSTRLGEELGLPLVARGGLPPQARAEGEMSQPLEQAAKTDARKMELKSAADESGVVDRDVLQGTLPGKDEQRAAELAAEDAEYDQELDAQYRKVSTETGQVEAPIEAPEHKTAA